ncbi:MAG: hypothetical protein JEZ04_17735 [Spirochaetales bacterium]|nr:hypothetical protein [Spirochaetales bacterium]
MKKFRFRAAGIFAVLILFFISNGVVAQTVEPSKLINNIDTSPLEYYLDKADRQSLQQQWLSYARFGLSAALSEWEQEILLLMGEDFELAPFRPEAEKKLNDIIEERLAAWLSSRFFNESSPPSLGVLDNEIENLNYEYLYERDSSGGLVRDGDGNIVYKTTIGYEDVYSVDEFGNKSLVSKGEKRLWTEGVKTVIDNLLAAWQNRTLTAHADLLASVSDPQLRSRLESAYKGNFDSYSRSYRRQLYRLYYMEQSRFTKLRLYDQRSLEHLSGQETASNVSNELISETQAALNSKMNALVEGLNVQVGEVQTSGGIIDARQWQESFKSLLSDGLSRWDGAEEALLMERIEWEQTAGKEISEGEKAWVEAFSNLRIKRSEWMSTYRQTLEEGNRLWAEESLELETVIDNALAELDLSIESSQGSLQSRMDNLVGMLLQSVNMMRTARSSWEYWMDQFDGGEKGSFDSRDVDFHLWSMRRKNIEKGYSSITSFGDKAAILNAMDWLESNYSGEAETLWAQNLSLADKEAAFASYSSYSQLSGAARALKFGLFSSALDDIFEKIRGLISGSQAGSASLREALYWTELFGTYQSYALSSQESLAETYGIVVFDDRSLRTAFNGEELDQSLLSEDLLQDGDAWESLYLDSWQVELLKAGAYKQYWEKQQQISQAVYDYAADNTSLKESAEATKARLNKAKADYDEIIGEYNRLLENLANIGIGLEEKHESMAAIQVEIDGYQSRLADARTEYKEMVTDLFVGNPEYLSDQYLTFYRELLASYGMDSEKEESGLGTAFEEYLLAAQKYGLDDRISLLSERLVYLLSGAESTVYEDPVFNPGTAGFSELHDRMMVSSEAGFTTDSACENPAFCFIGEANLVNDFNEYLKSSLFLKPDDYRYIQMNELFDEYHNPAGRTPAEVLWNMQRIVREVINKCSLDYETRLAEIRLHTTDDFIGFAARYFPGIKASEGESISDIYGLVTEPDSGPLDGLIPSITEDLGVYAEIMSLFDSHINSGSTADFLLYDWSSGGPESPGQLDEFQAYQKIWDYRKSLIGSMSGSQASDNDVSAEIALIIDSLAGLKAELERAGELSEYLDEFEAALLASNSDDRLNFLGNYLSGGHSLIASEGDLYTYLFSDRVSKKQQELAIAEAVRKSRTTAPVLSLMSHEQSYSELLGFLSDEGLLDVGTKTFRAPDALWNSRGFSSVAEVSAWFRHLDEATEDLFLPSYLREILSGCINELKDYASLKAAASWGGDIPVDLTGLNGEIRSLSTALAEGKAVIKSLQAGGDDGLKLWMIAESKSVPAALASDAENRLYDTVGFDLARKALLEPLFDDSSESWSRLLDEYLIDIKLSGKSGIISHTDEMLSRARGSYSLAKAIENPETTDWSAAPEDWLEIYQAAIWNSIGFDEALSLIPEKRSMVDIPQLKLLQRIDGLMPANAEDGLPGDIELDWLYGGETVLRELDVLVASDAPLLWADAGFNLAEAAAGRYYSDAELSLFSSRLSGADPAELALALWNDEFRGAAEGGGYGMLRAFTSLKLINDSFETELFYDEDYSFDDLLDDLTEGLALSAEDEALLRSVGGSPDAGLETWFTALDFLDPGSLGGEDLFWNLFWKCRTAADGAGYDEQAFRDEWIFGGDSKTAEALRGWIDTTAADYASYMARYNDALNEQAPALSRLASLPEGGLYAKILSYSLGALMIEDGGYSAAEAASFASWFLDKKGAVSALEAEALQNFSGKDAEERLWFLLDQEPEAALHHLKKKIINGDYTTVSLEMRLESLNGLSAGDKDSLLELFNLQNDIRIYRPLIHGSFEEYLSAKYKEDENLIQRQRCRYNRFRTNPAGQWDDPVFMVGIGLSVVDASTILEDLAFNRTRALNNSRLNQQSAMSVNEVFFSAAAETINRELWSGAGSLSDKLALNYARRDLSGRAAGYLESEISADNDHWRSFLSEEYLASAETDENLIPSGLIDVIDADYGRKLVINDEPAIAIEIFTGLRLFAGSGNDQDNFILDAGNSYLDRAAFLSSAVSGWKADEGILQGSAKLAGLAGIVGGDPGDDFWNYLKTAGYGRIADDYSYSPDAVLENNLSAKRSDFLSLLSGIDALKASLGSLGNRKEKLVRLSGQSDAAVAAALSPLKQKIIDLESSISSAQNDWQQQIDGAGGYRELEAEYAQVYAAARKTADELDGAKHQYSVARAIYEYASAGYLSIDEETNDDRLLELINKVSPSRRLSYVTEKFTRAEAAFDALSTIIGSNKENYSIYGKDEVYRSYFDSYMTSFRESLVLSKINLVLNKAVSRQETVVRKAFSDLNNDLHESYSQINIRNGNGDIEIPDSLTGLMLGENADGSWTIGWGSGKPDGAAAAGYFEVQEDSTTGLSRFEDDTLRWLEKVEEIQRQDRGEEVFTRWAMARKWEEYQKMNEAEQKDLVDAILNRNGEADLDREGGKAVLLAAWQSAYNSSCGGDTNERWMYDFYRLIDVSGLMQVDTTAAGRAAPENLSILADEESLIIANEYMADKFRQNAEALMASSIPLFMIAAYLFTIGTMAMSAVPFGWIAAMVIFVMASIVTANATMVLGDGTTRLAAAKNIKTDIIAPSKSSKSRFLNDFKSNTIGILNSRADFERESAKLEAMRGGTEEGENLTDAGRIEKLRNSVISAFNEEGDDLHNLLVQAGLVEQGGGAASDSAALDGLFGSCQSRMSETAKNECRSSSSFISALENEAREKKQIAACELNDYLTGPGGAAVTQNEAEAEYEKAYFRYIKEEISLDELKMAALAAWGNPVFSVREHLLRLYEGQSEIAGLILGSDQFNADISRDLLESQKLLLTGSGVQKGIYDYRKEAYREIRLNEMQMLKLEMAERRAHWENQMSAITACGQLEWSAGERKLNRSYKDWMDESRRAYRKQKDGWNDKYADFLSDKQSWLDAVTIQSTDYGNMEVLENFGSMTEGSIASAGADVLLGNMSEISINPDAVLSEVLDTDLLDKLLENAKSLNEGIADIKTVIFTAGGLDKFTTAGSLQAIRDFQGLKNEEYEKHLAVLEFNRLLEKVEYAEKNFVEQIENANDGIADGLHRKMRNDGYNLKGMRYERRLVVGCSLIDYIYDDGYVSTYNDYLAENVDFSGGLEAAAANIDNMDAGALEGIVDDAMDEIEDESRRIFGDEDDMSTYMLAEMGLTETKVEGETVYERQEVAVEQEDKGLIETILDWFIPDPESDDSGEGPDANDRRYVDISPGLFGLHIGFAPAFSDTPDLEGEWNDEGQLKYVGEGEMGRIMGEFIFNKYRENGGWAEVNLPHYKKRIYDDTNFPIKAPSMEEVTTLVTTVLTAGAGGSLLAFQSMAVNLADDLAFTGMDVEQGVMTWDEGLVSFSKKTAGAALGTLGGELFNGLGADAGLFDQILYNSANQTYSNITGSMVESITYSNDGGFGFNAAAFDEGVLGKDAIAGYVGSAAGLAAGDLISGTMDATTKGFYGSLGNIGNMAASEASKYAVYAGYQLAEDGFDDFGGSMAAAFDEMGLSVNILDIGSMLDLGRLFAATGANDHNDEYLGGLKQVSKNLTGTGLFALNFNSNGITGEITTGGLGIGSSLYNLGKGTIADLAIQNYSRENGNAGLLRTGYTFGDQSAEDTIWRLLTGKDSLHFDADGSEEAQTIKKTGGGRGIHLSSEYNNADGNELLKAAIVLQHEAHRDGMLGSNNDSETLRAVLSHTQMIEALGNAYGFDFMSGDNNLIGDISVYMAALQLGDMSLFSDYVAGAYDSSADYWKLVENPDGSLTLHDDGRGGVFYTDENGEEHEIGHFIGGSRTSHLQTVLGLNLTDEEKTRLNSEMLVTQGLAERYKDGHFLDEEGNQISIDLTGEWSDRMGAALDYDRMFVDAWRNDGNMDTMIEKLKYMNISEKYGVDYSDRQKYLNDKYDKAVDFSARFEAGTATEHLFSQTEIENVVGFGKNALCYGTVPVNLYQLRDPSISLDMVADTVTSAFSNKIIRKDGYIREYNKYLKSLGKGLGSSQYLKQGSDFSNLKDYLKSDYTMADYGIYGEDDNEHHTLYRNGYDAIDPYPYPLSWQEIEKYRFRGLEWMDF